MNGIILLLMTFLFACIHARATNYTVIMREPVKVCGDRLVKMLNELCDRKFHSEHNDVVTGSNLLVRSKRALRHVGVVDECCTSPCTIGLMSKYCQENPSYRNMVALHGQIIGEKAKKKQTTLTVLDNEVSKNGNSKERRQRANRKSKKPIYVECMYRSFAHYLLKHSRRLERHRRGRVGDIKKDSTQPTDQQQEGTATQHKLGGGTGSPKYSISF